MGSRADSLGRFTAAYSQLARLPAPTLGRVELSHLVSRVAELEQRKPIRVVGGPPITLEADADQIEQLLINLVRNAVDATIDTEGRVSLEWDVTDSRVRVRVDDEGPGLSNTANLFVPFFTTKPGGSGIGLVLCRQIAEAHGGGITLENRTPGPGCRAELTLPL